MSEEFLEQCCGKGYLCETIEGYESYTKKTLVFCRKYVNATGYWDYPTLILKYNFQ